MSVLLEKTFQMCSGDSLIEDEFINSESITMELEEMHDNKIEQPFYISQPTEIIENDQTIKKRTRFEDFYVVTPQKVLEKLKENLIKTPDENKMMDDLEVDQAPNPNTLIIIKEHLHNKNIECALCEYKCNTSDALRTHLIKGHQNPLGSTCDLCNRKFKDIESHVKYFHNTILMHKCTYCEKEFKSNSRLESHVTSFHNGNKVNCPECNKNISRENFSRHRKEKHERIRQPCPYCEEEFGMSNLSRHIRSAHDGGRDSCPECGKSFSVSNLNKHIKNVHLGLIKTCDICKRTVPASSISYHKRKFHNVGKPIQEVTPRGPHKKKLTI